MSREEKDLAQKLAAIIEFHRASRYVGDSKELAEKIIRKLKEEAVLVIGVR